MPIYLVLMVTALLFVKCRRSALALLLFGRYDRLSSDSMAVVLLCGTLLRCICSVLLTISSVCMCLQGWFLVWVVLVLL